MTSNRSFARYLAIPAIAIGIALSSAAPASAGDDLLPVVQEVTGTAKVVSGTVESVVFELSSALTEILGAG